MTYKSNVSFLDFQLLLTPLFRKVYLESWTERAWLPLWLFIPELEPVLRHVICTGLLNDGSKPLYL